MGQKFTPRCQKAQLPKTLLLKIRINSVPTAVIYFGGNCRPSVILLVFAVFPLPPETPDGSFSSSAGFKSLGIFPVRFDKCAAAQTGFPQRSASFGVLVVVGKTRPGYGCPPPQDQGAGQADIGVGVTFNYAKCDPKIPQDFCFATR